MKTKTLLSACMILLLFITPMTTAAAATNSDRYSLANDSTYTAMDSITTDGTYVYVLKHVRDQAPWKIFTYRYGDLIDVKSQNFTGTIGDHANGITYYNGHLYVATIQNFVYQVKVTDGDVSSTATKLNVPLKENIATVGAITHIANNLFIIRGKKNTYALYELKGSTFTFRFKLTNTEETAAYDTIINDIFFYNNVVYVVTFDGVNKNKIARYKLSGANLTYHSSINITGGSGGQKFELEGGCVIGGKLYYTTNDQNGDSIYTFKTILPTI